MSTSTLPTLAEAFGSAAAKIATVAEDLAGAEIVVDFTFNLDSTGTYTHSETFPFQVPLQYTLTILEPALTYTITVTTNHGYEKTFVGVTINTPCSDTISGNVASTTITTVIQSTPNTEGGKGSLGLQLAV